ncbi:MAG: twin-arginine translocation signal domain-containing protein [Haloarculaceae archaeon]
MSEWSRRRALQAVAATGAVVLTGCSGESSSSSDVPPDRGDPVPPSDLEVRFVRDAGNEPLFDVEGEDGNEGGGTRPGRRTRAEFLTSGTDRDRVAFRSGSAADDLRAFVDGSDLESGSVYLIERPVSACYEARLVGVYREDDGVDVDLCQALRPADVACSADGMDTVGVGIRLPFAGDSMSGHGWGWSGECGSRPTVASEGGDGS